MGMTQSTTAMIPKMSGVIWVVVCKVQNWLFNDYPIKNNDRRNEF
jgi:hypothetical protein